MKSNRIIYLLLSVVTLVISCDSNITITREYHDKKLPLVKTTFASVVVAGWNKNIHDIQDVFQGGEFVRGNQNRRVASQYKMKAEFSDINFSGRLSFSQFEGNKKNLPGYDVIRKILVKNESKEYLEQIYHEICKFFEQNFENSTRVKYIDESKAKHHIYDIEYRLINFDAKGDVHIGIDLSDVEKWLDISITHSLITKKPFEHNLSLEWERTFGGSRI